jgi:putative ABC transport system permease protein
MSLLTAFSTSLRLLLVHKGRSALTVLGIIIGIAAVVGLIGAVDGARLKLDRRLDTAGKNLILIRPGSRSWNGVADYTPLTAADSAAVGRRLRPLLLGTAPIQATPKLLTSRTEHWNTVLVGTTPSFVAVENWKLVAGRCFNGHEERDMAHVCVIGQTVHRRLLPGSSNPVGQTLRVERLRLRVIGLLGAKGRNPIGVDQDDQVFIPLTTLQRQVVGKEEIAMILAAVKPESNISATRDRVVEVMRRRHHLKPGDPANFDVATVEELASFAVVLGITMRVLVAVIASVSLLVGGIGIMNIMLAALVERTHEIGIRMSVGATPADILLQFLLEAVVLASLGGVLGILIGLGGVAGAALLADWPLVVSPFVLALAFGISAAVGVFFGYYPAWKASRLDPIQALRYE